MIIISLTAKFCQIGPFYFIFSVLEDQMTVVRWTMTTTVGAGFIRI